LSSRSIAKLSKIVNRFLPHLSRRFANVFINAIRQLAHLVWFVYLRRACFTAAVNLKEIANTENRLQEKDRQP